MTAYMITTITAVVALLLADCYHQQPAVLVCRVALSVLAAVGLYLATTDANKEAHP